MTVELEPEPLEAAKKRAARQIAQRTRIPGFRPGKAPYAVVLRSVGENVVTQEAMDLLLEEVYPKIIEESDLKPYSAGTLDNILSLDPPTLEFTVPLAPVVTLPEYQQIRFPYELTPVTEGDVNQVLEDLRDRHAAFEPVDRPAEDGDQVTLRLRAERKQPVEGKDLTLINDRQTVLTVHPESDPAKSEWPFSGFSRHLVGMAASSEKSFEYTYPEDSDLENLRGVEALFYIKIEAVKLRKLPDLDDNFAQTLGEYETLEKLREEILNGLTEQRKNDYENEYQNKIIDEILKGATILYPPQMLEGEVAFFRNQLERRLAQQNLDMATYLRVRQLTEDGLKKELLPSAEQRLRRSLLLFEIARKEDIKVDEQAVQNEAISTINQIQQSYKPEESRRMLTQGFMQNVVVTITSDQLVQKTLMKLMEMAQGKVQTTSETISEPGTDPTPSQEGKTEASSESEASLAQAPEANHETTNTSDDPEKSDEPVEPVKKSTKKRKRKDSE